MEIEQNLREDLWKAIQAHYERKDYTEAVRDCMYHICDVLREKSGLQDRDGTKLVEGSLLGSNPAILINKNESTTEKDIQQGVGFAFKGLMQSVRNPLSHEKAESYTEQEAEAIILYSNYLLNRVDRSGGTTKIDDVVELLLDEDFTDTEEYASLLLKEVPIKKRYDLLLQLYSIRHMLPQHKLKYFINLLIDSLSKAAKTDFVQVISKSLMKCKDDKALRMYCHYFMVKTFNDVDKLAQLRVEDLALKSIWEGESEYSYDPTTKETTLKCLNGSLGTWFNNRLDLMSNKGTIIDELIKKTERGGKQEDYVFEYFHNIMDHLFSDRYNFSNWQIALIKRKLNKGSEHYYNLLFGYIVLDEDKGYKELFDAEFKKCEEIIKKGEEELPF